MSTPSPRPNDLSPEDFRRYGYQAVDWIADYLANIRDYPVMPSVKPGDLTDALPASAPHGPEPVEDILRDFRDLVVPAVNHWNHPRFHAYFSVSASGPGILGDMLSSALNVNGMLWKSCPAAVELEMVVMGWLRQWLGLPEEFFGIVHDTASVSTLHAIGAARVMADPELRTRGAAPGYALYTSAHAHSSVEKSAMALGVGQQFVRKIGVDAEYRMRPDLLEAAIDQDLAGGLKPFCVVSTVGTTSVTSADPVALIQDVADRHNLWHHIDGAYGGFAAMLPENRWMLDGADRAHSLVLNPHKWLFTPIDFSAFYCRRPDLLKAAYSLTPPYLSSTEDPRAVNLMDYRIPLGSRFRALKLWFVMRAFGRDKVFDIVRSHCLWAREVAAEIQADPRFEVVAPVPMSLVCFRYRGSDDQNRRLLDLLNASGVAFSSGNILDGRFVLRLAVGNIAVTRDDVFTTWHKVRELASRLEGEATE